MFGQLQALVMPQEAPVAEAPARGLEELSSKLRAMLTVIERDSCAPSSLRERVPMFPAGMYSMHRSLAVHA